TPPWPPPPRPRAWAAAAGARAGCHRSAPARNRGSSWVCPLDVIHRPRAAATLPRPRDQFTEGDAIHHLRHRLRDLQPEVREVDGGARLEGGARALDGAQHGADRDVLGIASEMIAARRAALGGQEPGAFERQEHLFEVALR